MTFQIYTIETAPGPSREMLKEINEKKGFVPNIAGILAGAPPVLEALLALQGITEKTSFSPHEREVIFLTVSHKNGSAYCSAVHRQAADESGLPADLIEEVQSGAPLTDVKLEALRQYTLGVMQNRGRPSDIAIDTFLAAGYKPPQALEIVLAIALKTLTNYANRLAHPPIDEVFQKSPDHHMDPQQDTTHEI